MLTILGLLMFLALFLIVIGIVLIVVNKVKRGSIKKSLYMVGIGLIILIISAVLTVFTGADFKVTTVEESQKLHSALENDEDISGKTLTFTVAETGKNKEQGLVALGVPSEEERPINIMLPYNDKTKDIQNGDIITVKFNRTSNLFGITIIDSTLE